MVLSPFLSGKVIYFDENGFGNGSIWCKLGMKPGHVNTATKEKTEQKKEDRYFMFYRWNSLGQPIFLEVGFLLPSNHCNGFIGMIKHVL
jgi:hypothetical protein